MRQFIAAGFAVLLALSPAVAEDAFDTLLRIEFRKGYDFSNFDDAVSGKRVQGYVVHGRKGQTIKMKINALHDDVAFTIYEPGATVTRADYLASIVVDGTILADADHRPPNVTWAGKLPATGDYVIVFSQMTPSDSAAFGGVIIVR